MRTARTEGGNEARWRTWAPSWLASHRPSRLRTPKPPGATTLAAPARRQVPREDLKKRIATTAIAFRGYDVGNIGRSPELLEHPAYGRIVRPVLEAASAVCSDALGSKVDLVARITDREPSDLSTFVHDIGTDRRDADRADSGCLEEVFDIPVRQARLSFGHSIGELSALVLGGVYEMEQLLPDPSFSGKGLRRADRQTPRWESCRCTGRFCRSRMSQHLCSSISSRGQGLIGPSTYLSPYQVLLLGQGTTR